MKDSKLILSSLLIIISFFIWFTFSKEKYKGLLSDIKKEIYYVDIEIKNNKININNQNKNIIILVNWEESSSWTIIMK